MPEFAFTEQQRDDWSDEAAAAIILVAAAMRKKIAGNLTGPLPENTAAVWNSAWWDEGVATAVDETFRAIADDATATAADGMGIDLDDDTRERLAAAVAASVAVLVLHRGTVVDERVGAVLQTAASEEHDSEWVATTLGVTDADGDESGPLSTAVMTAMGVSVGLAVADVAAEEVASHGVKSGQVTGEKTWTAHLDERTRPTHWVADGQTVPVGDVFTIGGFPGVAPHDPMLPISETAGCRCYLTYSMTAADETVSGEGGDVESDVMEDLPIAASTADRTPFPLRQPVKLVSRSWDDVRFYGTKAMARKMRTFAPDPVVAVPQPSAPTAEPTPEPDHTDGIAITLEPTVAEKQMLAIPGGTTPDQIHVTLAYLGTTAELDESVRAQVSTCLANFATLATPMQASVAGVGWFNSPQAMTLALIDSPELAAFRSNLVDNLVADGVDVKMDHGFIPHATLGYSELDASDKVGMPLHFDSLRCRWGTDVYVWDLMGPMEHAPEPAAPDNDKAPALETEIVPVTAPVEETATMDTADAADMIPIEPDGEEAPADVASLPDEALIAEVARRAADAAIEMVGSELSNDDVAAIHAATEEDAAEMWNELVESAAGAAGDETDDGDWETGPDGEPDEVTVPIGGTEGYALATGFRVPPGGGILSVQSFASGGVVTPSHRGQAFAIEGIRPAPQVSEFEWEGPITVEGVPSGDSRMFAEGALDWRQLPVPLAFLDKITSEHQEGQLAGWCHSIERRDGGAIWGKGTYARVDGEMVPAAVTLKGIMNDPTGPGRYGVSVDVDSVTAVYSTPDGTIMDPMEAQEAYYAGENVMMMMTSGRVAGLTAVLHPAYQEAQVWNVGPAAVDDGLAIAASGGISDTWRSISPGSLRPFVAGVVASAADCTTVDVTAPPPAAWFDLDAALLAERVATSERGAFDTFAPDTKGRIRVFGIVAPPNECHIGIADACTLMPRSRDFSHFYATGKPSDPWAPLYSGAAFDRFYADSKAVICDGGERVVVGPVILDNVHPNLRRQASDAQPFYAHTGSAVADVRLHMTPHGLVAAGAIRPGVSWIDVYKLRASTVSPDWRPFGRENKVIAVLAVNVSGFQLAVAASAGGVTWEDAIVETQERVEALVASAGVARGRKRLASRVSALEAEVAALRDGIEPIIVRNQTELRTAVTSSALAKMGVAPTRLRTVSALAAMGLAEPEPCGCSSDG